MTRTYIVDDNGNEEPVDWYDFLTNDDNPTLKRLADKLLNDPEFQELMEKIERENNNDYT